MTRPTDFVLAIDGGASHTRAWIVRLDGTVLARGTAGGSNAFELGIDAARRVIAEATHAAWQRAGLPGEKPCAFLSVWAGVAGAGAADVQRSLASALAAEFGVSPVNSVVDSDLRIAQAGALAGAPGAIILAGTGSAAYGRTAAGETARAGGWGPVLDDGGSGHWLGIQAMRLVVRMADGRQTSSALANAVMLHLDSASPRELLHRLQPGNPAHLSRAVIASLAPLVLEAAEAGDPTAAAVLDLGANELVEMARAVVEQLATKGDLRPRLAGVGGLLESSRSYFERVAAGVSRCCAGVTLERAQLSPVAGAALLAIAQAGTALGDEVVRRLGATDVAK